MCIKSHTIAFIEIHEMKAITVRLEDDQAERLEELKRELHNSDAGVLRFALDLLHRTVTEKGAVPAAMASEAQPAAA
jgi:predicted transcriptional regulator